MKVETGVPNMDKLIEKGISRGSLVLISGQTGTGKTTLALQYLANGMTELGEFGVFVSFVDDREDILRTAKRFGWNLGWFERVKTFKFLGFPPGKIMGFSEKADASGENLIDEIIKAVEDFEAERLALDGLREFRKMFEDNRSYKAAIARLRRELRNLECTSIITSKPDSGVEEIFDAIIVLHYNGGLEKIRSVEVVKVRGSSHTNRMCPFEIGDKGIAITGPPEEKE